MKRRGAGNLQEDIIFQQILTRISAKTLIKFKCVSKHWYESISSPWFLKFHLLRSLPSGRSNVLYNRVGNFVTLFFHDPNTGERYEIHVENITNQSLSKISTCDGMVFIETSYETSYPHQTYSHFILYPVTRYLLRLPSPPSTWCKTSNCVFVFDDLINQYQLVVWNGFLDVKQHETYRIPEQICSVWTLGIDSSWRKMTLPGGYQWATCSPTRVNRTIYWTAMNKRKHKRILLSMDISTEEITEHELPCPLSPGRLTTVMALNGALYFIYGAFVDFHFYIIWVLEDLDKNKWTKLYQKTRSCSYESCECGGDPGYTVIDEGYKYGEIELKAKESCVHNGVYREHFNSLVCLQNMEPALGLNADNMSNA